MRRPSNQPNATDGASRLLWLRLTEPPTAIANEGDRHSARLLAGVLLVLVTLGFASAIVQILAVPGFTTPFAIIVGALLLLGVAYGISRTKHYRLAAVLASLVPVSAGAAVGLVAPADPVWFAFMGLGPIVASGFLPARHVGGVAGFTVVATLLVLFAEGALSAEDGGIAVLSFSVSVSSLVTLVAHHRARVERARQRDVQERQTLYRLLFEDSPLGIGMAGPDGRLLAFNDAMLAPGRYARHDLERIPAVSALYYDAETRPALLEQLRRDGRVIGAEVRLRAKDGMPYEVSLNLVPIMFDGQRCTMAIAQDISARRRAESERSDLAEILERSLNEVYLFDPDTLRFEYANEGARRNVGYSMEQLRALTPVDLKPAFDQASFERLLAPLLRGETSLLVFETEHRRADGTRYPVEVHLQLAMRPQRRVVLAVILDVSARRAAEHETQELSAELTAQGQRFRSLIEDSTDLIALVSADGLIQYLNPAFGTILEHDPEGWIGENLLDLVWPDDRQAAVALLARGLRTPGEGIPWQLRVRHADGAFRWLEGTGTNHLDDPATHGIVINCRDVTARRQSEDVLRENEQRLRVAIDTANLTLFEMDTDLRYTWIYNPQLGYSSDAQIGRTDQELLGDEGLPIMAVKRRALESGQRVREEVTIRQGRVDVTLDLTVEPKRTAAGRVDGVRGASLDVSRFKALQALLVQAQKLETVGQLVGGVAHDYNNMLSVILMNVTHALTVVDPSSPIRADLEDIHQASRRSADLTRQLLAFARKQPVAPKVLDLNQTVSSTCSMLRRIIGEDIVLDWRPGADVAPVNVDPAQLEQVLLNLCLNAQDAIVDVGTVTIATTNVTLDEAYCADHPGSAPGRYVLLTVSDDGTGMDRATLDRIFEPFFTTKEVGRGTGMGLATTYGIAKQNNGFLTASSELGRGTTVGLYLPQAEAEIAGTPLERPATGLRSHGETVLVVEDEEAVLRGTRRLLTDLGYTVLAADTPTKALRVAAEHTGAIHLLLTDLVMPEMNGVDLAGQLKARHPDLKCMLMSAHPAEAHALGPARETIMSVIQKPFTQEALGAAVRAALGGPGLHDLAHS